MIICIITTLPSCSLALECFCNECQDDESCTTELHQDSNCFKSVHKVIENNTYVVYARYGCISGANDSLMSLQCHISNLNHREPVFISCCNDADRCNLELPDPNELDDPRWRDDKSVRQPQTEQQVPVYQQYYSSIALFCLISCIIILVTCLIRNCRQKNIKAASQSSIYVDDYVERLKSHVIDNNSPPSSQIFTISDDWSHKSDSPCEQSCASYEQTNTLPDLTSGVGTRVLEERTIARNIGSRCMLPVGSGRHGRVFMGEYHFNKVAVKAFRSVDAEAWRREETILKKIHHENVIRWIASETVSVSDYVTETWMIIEFCPYGSLCDFLDHYEISNPHQAIKIVHSIIQGINYLHEDLYRAGGKPPIAHRDIKSRNILMKTPEVCCIADFGHAVVKIDDARLDFGGNDRLQVGTVRYMAPEILKPEDLDVTQFYTFAQADLYQFALVLWEVAQRTKVDESQPAGPHRLPYDGVVTQNPDLDDMVKIVCEINYRPPITPYWERHPIMQQLATLMVECWRPNPKARMETLGVMKRVLDLYEKLQPQHMYNHMFYNNLISDFSPNFRSDKDHSRSSGGEKTQTTLNMF